MIIHWEEVKLNSQQIDSFDFNGKYWREFLYSGEKDDYTWFAYDIDNPYFGNPIFIEEGYTPRRINDISPNQAIDKVDTSISYVSIEEQTGYSELWVEYDWKYNELYDGVGEYIDYAILLDPDSTTIDTEIFVNDILLKSEKDFEINPEEGSSLKYIIYPFDSFDENLEIKIKNKDSNWYSETEQHYIPTSINKSIVMDFSSEEKKSILIPIVFEYGEVIENISFDVINKIGISEYPKKIDEIIRIESEDFETTNYIVKDIPNISISLPKGFSKNKIRTKWKSIDNGYTLIVDGDYYYDHETKQLFDHEVSGEVEKYEDAFPLPLDFSQNVGSFDYIVNLEGVFDIELNITQDIGNLFSFKGEENSLLKVKKKYIDNYEYFNNNKLIGFSWTQEDFNGE